MKFANNINERITQYLNDIEDYGDSDVYTPSYTKLCEETLSGVKPLIVESLNPMTILENYKNTLKGSEKEIVEDFILYVNNIQ
jgi:hypothetical protein